MRIAITGASGNGKTTLARRLAETCDLRHVEIDALHHGPNWESCGPEVLLIGEAQVKGQGYELLRRMRRDTRLRWVSLLVVRWDEIWSDALLVPALSFPEANGPILKELARESAPAAGD